MEDLRVAAVCMNAEPGEVNSNLTRMRAFATEASAEGAQIVCFPELCVTGYVLKNPDEVYRGLDPEEILKRLLHMAEETGLFLIAGLIQISSGQRPWITQIITGPEGLVGLHKKSHLSPAEKDNYQAGQEIKAFKCGNTTIGVALCYEAHFPEISTILALLGADILFFPHASPRGNPKDKSQSWLRHLPGRAFDNGAFVVACNQVGDTSKGFCFPGVALVLGPDGRVLAKYTGDEEKILFADLKAEELSNTREHRMKYFIPQRRPELYKRIVGS
jgi:N-carbamoylputrescine amidase